MPYMLFGGSGASGLGGGLLARCWSAAGALLKVCSCYNLEYLTPEIRQSSLLLALLLEDFSRLEGPHERAHARPGDRLFTRKTSVDSGGRGMGLGYADQVTLGASPGDPQGGARGFSPTSGWPTGTPRTEPSAARRPKPRVRGAGGGFGALSQLKFSE